MDSTKREKVCRGGFKTDEDYTYIRGRGRGSYVCETCGIRCRKPSMLKKHIRTHTDHRPYHCVNCKFSFKTKGNLTKHMKSKAHHKKCLELGFNPVPTSVEDCQIDDDELAAQMSMCKEEDGWVVESMEEDDDGEDYKDMDDDQDVISLASDDEENEESIERSNSQGEVPCDASSPVYVAVQTSKSNQPALIKITQRAVSSSLGTVYGFEGTSYADRAMSPDKNIDSGRSQNIDTEIARSLLELSKKAETSESEEGEKKETRLGNLIGALMSRTKPLSGLQSKEDNSVSASQPASSQTSIVITDIDADIQTTEKQPSSSTTKRPSDLFLGIDERSGRKRFYFPTSPAKTPKDKEATTYPQTPLNASILSYLPPSISMKLGGATKNFTYRGPIIGQLIQQDSVVMTPLVPTVSISSGMPFQFSHPFQFMEELPHSSENIQPSDLRLNTREPTLTSLHSSVKDGTIVLQSSTVPGTSSQVIYVVDKSKINVSDTKSSEGSNAHVCNVCSKSFSDSYQLAVHIDMHNVEYNCEHCALRFISKTLLRKHLDSHEHSSCSLSTRSFKCIHCGMSFLQEDKFVMHLRSRNHFRELEGLGIISKGVYESLDSSGELLQLDVSDPEVYFHFLISKSAELSEKHEKVIMAINVASTSQSLISCDKQFATKSDYEKHDEASNERVTVEIKQEPIDIGDIGQRNCGDEEGVDIIESQSSGSVLKSSTTEGKDNSTSDGPHMCGICRKGFRDLQELRSHILTHAELRPYVCEYCDAGFTNAQSLKTHLHTHMQERPYVCGRCGDTFTQSDDLHLHMSTHSTLMSVKSMDQSKPMPSHSIQSTLRPTMSLDQSKSLPDINQSTLRTSYSVDQSQPVFINMSSFSQSTSTSEDQSSASCSSPLSQSPLIIDQSESNVSLSPMKQVNSLDNTATLNSQSNTISASKESMGNS